MITGRAVHRPTVGTLCSSKITAVCSWSVSYWKERPQGAGRKSTA